MKYIMIFISIVWGWLIGTIVGFLQIFMFWNYRRYTIHYSWMAAQKNPGMASSYFTNIIYGLDPNYFLNKPKYELLLVGIHRLENGIPK